MDVQPMDLEEAETLARGGNVGRVSAALFRELERQRDRAAELERQCDRLLKGAVRVRRLCNGPRLQETVEILRALDGVR